MMIASLLIACVQQETALLADCRLETSPTVGEWTEDYVIDTNPCDDGHPYGFALYVGQVTATDGPRASMAFRKSAEADSAAPLATIQWWILQHEGDFHDCYDVANDPAIAYGIWDVGVEVLEVPDVAIWASNKAFEAAVPDSRVSIYLATTGSDDLSVRRWWQRDSLEFSRRCPEDTPL